ncbi:MAG: hypothetical protein ACYSW8_32390 [Planctomycetota bacterium]|jgi:hypothetical protein
MALQGFSAFQQGREVAYDERLNESIARHNALLAERDARAEEVKLAEDQMLMLFEKEQIMGSARVRAGASGARTDVGAPFMMRAQMGSLLDFKRFRAAREGRKAIEDFKQEAAAFTMKAGQHRERAKSAKRAGALGAGSAILGGLAQGVRQGYWFQPKTA